MLSKTSLIQFWVGFLDGDGSIQVNHWKKKYLQFRFVIQIKNTPKNLEMCFLFKETLGGTVRQYPLFIVWVEDHQRNIWKLLDILEKTPPLTTRLQLQLLFMKESKKKGLTWMLENRSFKYSQRKILKVDFENISYWRYWLAGFIEAEGCFCIRKNGLVSFSIGQKHEYFLLLAIRDFFGGKNIIQNNSKDFFFWEVYRKTVCQKICLVLENSLIGEKSLSFDLFHKHFKV